LLIYTHSSFWVSVGGGAGGAVSVGRDGDGPGCVVWAGGVTVGEFPGVGDAIGRGVVVGAFRCIVFLDGGRVWPSSHCFRLACGLVGARVGGDAGGGGAALGCGCGCMADIIAGAMGWWGEEANGFFFVCAGAEYSASCLSSMESALSTLASSSRSSLASADDVDTVSRYASGSTFSLPFKEARWGWVVVTARSLLVVGAFSSSGIVITRSMIFVSDVAGAGVASIGLVAAGGCPVCWAGEGIRLAASSIISPSNFCNAFWKFEVTSA
jgi:hypothetical protein